MTGLARKRKAAPAGGLREEHQQQRGKDTTRGRRLARHSPPEIRSRSTLLKLEAALQSCGIRTLGR
jgi:hypothetical protein